MCNFCNATVRFIAANDPAGRFAFAALQSAQARALLDAGAGRAQTGAGDASIPESFILLDYGHRYERSDAVLHLAVGLRAPWPLAFAAILIPRPLRDAAYRWMARNRYRWFGKQDVCPVPPPGLRARFLSE